MKLSEKLSELQADLKRIEEAACSVEAGNPLTDEVMQELIPIGDRSNFLRDLLIRLELEAGHQYRVIAPRWEVTHARISQIKKGLLT